MKLVLFVLNNSLVILVCTLASNIFMKNTPVVWQVNSFCAVDLVGPTMIFVKLSRSYGENYVL